MRPEHAGRRAAILDAALALFAEQGYEVTTVAQIGARAGASTGSMYHHFASKEDVAAALRAEALATYQDTMLAELARHDRAEDGIRGLVRRHVAWAVEEPRLAGYLLSSPPPAVRRAAEEPVARANARFFGALRDWLAGHRAAGALRALPAGLEVPLWLGPSQAYLRALLAGRAEAPAAIAAEELAAAAWRALRVDPG